MPKPVVVITKFEHTRTGSRPAAKPAVRPSGADYESGRQPSASCSVEPPPHAPVPAPGHPQSDTTTTNAPARYSVPPVTPNPPTTPPQTTPAAPQEAAARQEATARTTNGPSKTVKVMAILIAVLSGTVGALIALLLTRHLGATALIAIGSAGVTFLGVTGTVKHIEEKLGLL
ncbi:hypothetical protein ACFYYM_39805 [Streptomyces erythrochromogenes]|uniref:hypothetical protein n=1 Tax=Streptomyces erythrochromogenes TaxID=285574 RepID=UPI00368D7827